MEILNYCGCGGSGKTLDATCDAVYHYRKENRKIKYLIYKFFSVFPVIGIKAKEKIDYYNSFPYKRINNIYSSYPILLDKKREIYSNKWSIFDFNNNWSFLPNAVFIDDEIQLKIDSDEYKDNKKNKEIAKIAKFMQSARHFGCNKIIITTQHPSRFFKKGRNVTAEFVMHRVKWNFKIPILKIGWIKTVGYTQMDDYGKFIPKDKEARKLLTFEYFKHFKLINYRDIYKRYDSRYLSNWNYGKPLYDKGQYKSLKVPYDDLVKFFEEDN